jgi:hypothetical protein
MRTPLLKEVFLTKESPDLSGKKLSQAEGKLLQRMFDLALGADDGDPEHPKMVALVKKLGFKTDYDDDEGNKNADAWHDDHPGRPEQEGLEKKSSDKKCKSCGKRPAEEDGYCDHCFPSDGSSNK